MYPALDDSEGLYLLCSRAYTRLHGLSGAVSWLGGPLQPLAARVSFAAKLRPGTQRAEGTGLDEWDLPYQWTLGGSVELKLHTPADAHRLVIRLRQAARFSHIDGRGLREAESAMTQGFPQRCPAIQEALASVRLNPLVVYSRTEISSSLA
jgi:hypothetical protein